MTSPQFKNRREAAEFYGFKEARFYALIAKGKAASDPMPVDEPAKMPAWFERMKDSGALKYRVPDRVYDRAGVKTPGNVAPVSKTGGSGSGKNAKCGTGAEKTPSEPGKRHDPPDPAPADPIILAEGDSAPIEEMIAQERQLLATFHRDYVKEITTNGSYTDKATQLFRRRQELQSSVQSLMKAAKTFRTEGDYYPRREVARAAETFVQSFVQALRTNLPMEFPRSEYERVLQGLDRVAARLPEILPKEFAA